MNNEDFITIKKINYRNSEIFFVDYDYDDNQIIATKSNSYPQTISLQTKSKKIEINKTYNKHNILQEFIDKIIEISDPSTYNERVFEHKTINEINTQKDKRSIMSRMFSCSNYIAVNGRLGPAHFVLVPYFYYQKLYELIVENKIGGMEIFPTNLLFDKIIFGRKNDTSQPGLLLLLNEKENKYALTDIGHHAKNQYHILKITSLHDDRRKKLKEIEKSARSARKI